MPGEFDIGMNFSLVSNGNAILFVEKSVHFAVFILESLRGSRAVGEEAKLYSAVLRKNAV